MANQAWLAVLRTEPTELAQVTALLRESGADPAALTVAAGDRLLLRLHRELTGADLELPITCRHCAQINAVRLAPETVPPHIPSTAVLGPGGGLRQPTFADLESLPQDETAAEDLLTRCTVGKPPRPPTPADLDRIDDTLTGEMEFACASCDADVVVPLDVPNLVLRALVRLLEELDRDVHLLASAYGWDLATIEALPAERRRRLADLVTEGSP